jgi:nitrate reductase gamma subunit
MSTGDFFLWVVIPYVAITIFVVGHVWRYRHDQFGWTSRSTQLLERRLLKWGSPLFHYGALAAIGGHVLGILVPQTTTSAIGVDEHAYHLISAVLGTLAGVATLAGLAILIYRRAAIRRVAVTTSYVDLAVYALLFVVITIGLLATLSHNLFASGNGYNYRHTVAIWFRGVFAFQDNAALMAGVPLIYQLHVLLAWAILALWPFSRLVHAWSIPLQYIGRPYILYRRRYSRPGLRSRIPQPETTAQRTAISNR